jgi:hypothetical protein
VLVGLKLGAYGLIRFAIPLAPLAARDLHWLLAGFGTVAILYGGVAALAQSNLRRVLAYSSLAHVGLVLLGLASFSVSALQGALLQLLNFSVAAGGGFLVLSFLQRRTGSTDITQLGGVMRSMPRLSGFFLLFGLAGIGLPGTSGFPGELLIIVAVRCTAIPAPASPRCSAWCSLPQASCRHSGRPFSVRCAIPTSPPQKTCCRASWPAAAACPVDPGGRRLSAADPRTAAADRRGLGGGAGGALACGLSSLRPEK